MGDNLISGKFISTFGIPTKDLDTPINLRMAVKGSRSTINYKAQPVIQIGQESGEIADALVCSLDNYDIFLGMPYLTAHRALIDCGKATITFPDKNIILSCKKGNTARFSAMTEPKYPDFIKEYPQVFPAEKIT